MLGHELRNPLAPALTALQLLKLRGDIRASSEQLIIERQLKHMVRLVDDLLDVSRIARGTFQIKKERIDLHEVIARAIELASPLIEDRRHELEVKTPPGSISVDGDPVRLAQTFANLLTNAAKYTDPGGHIDFVVTVGPGQVEVEVHDRGMGIDPELLPKVFETFVQASQSVARSAGGMGIGLSLVRSFVRLHGGTVEARSPGLGRGSTFTVKLPLAPGEPRPREDTGEVDPGVLVSGRPLRVLIVDDNQDALLSVAELLRMVGHEVQTAISGPTALAVLRGFRPDVAILDIGLPGMDGFELAGQVRALLGNPQPRLIAMTGYGQETDRDRSVAAGFDLHLVKPVDLDVLLRSLADRPNGR